MSDQSGVAKEIERKFLLTQLPPEVQKAQSYQIIHGWIPGEVIQERITWTSKNGGEYWRVIKTGKGIERIEAQEKIDDVLWTKLFAACGPKTIKKTRYYLPVRNSPTVSADLEEDGHKKNIGCVNTDGDQCPPSHYSSKLVWEIDAFEDRHLGLFLAEIEIPTVDYPLEIPAWLQTFLLKEVTDDPCFLNINLAKNISGQAFLAQTLCGHKCDKQSCEDKCALPQNHSGYHSCRI